MSESKRPTPKKYSPELCERLTPGARGASLTGPRRGELHGLCWGYIDSTRNLLLVRQQIVEVDSTGIMCSYCKGEHKQFRFSAPKTASGESRTVDLDVATVEMHMAQKLAQDMEREKWGSCT